MKNKKYYALCVGINAERENNGFGKIIRNYLNYTQFKESEGPITLVEGDSDNWIIEKEGIKFRDVIDERPIPQGKFNLNQYEESWSFYAEDENALKAAEQFIRDNEAEIIRNWEKFDIKSIPGFVPELYAELF